MMLSDVYMCLVVVIDNGIGYMKMGFVKNVNLMYVILICVVENVFVSVLKWWGVMDDLDFVIGDEVMVLSGLRDV